MAVTEDELFERAIDEIVKVAEELLKDKDPKSKTFVTEQINDLQKSIEQKLIQADIEDDETEIQSIQDRIKKLLERGVEDPGDKALDHVKVFQNLKEKEWEEVISETEDPLHIVHEKLLKILKRAFKAAAEHMRDSRAKIVQQVLQPGSDFIKTQDRRQDVEAVHKQEADLIELSSQCQLKAMPFCIDSIKKNIRDAILDKDKDLCTVPNASDALNTAIDNYFLKCIEFSWAAAFEELPPILLVCDPKKECPKISDSFANLKKVPRQYTVVWPALVQGDSIISPWVLSEKTQPHPIPTQYKDEEQVSAEPQSAEQVKPQSTSPMISSMPKMILSPQHPQSVMSVKLQSDLAHKKTSNSGNTRVKDNKNGKNPNMKNKDKLDF